MRKIVEFRKTLSNNTLVSASRFVKSTGKSTVQETFKLSCRNGEWAYASTVQGQKKHCGIQGDFIKIEGLKKADTAPKFRL